MDLPIRYIPSFLSADEAESLRSNVDTSKRGWVELSGRRLLNLGGLVTPKGLIAAPLPPWAQRLSASAASAAGFGDDGGGGGGSRSRGGAPPPNHVLVNRYRSGEGILPHEDGPAYEPRVAIVSLGSPAVLRFWKIGKGRRRQQEEEGGGSAAAPSSPDPAVPVPGVDPPDASVFLEDRSLVVFEGEAYTACYHGIEACEAETIDGSVINPEAARAAAAGDGAPPSGTSIKVPRQGDRISFTIRRVERVRPLLQLSARQG